MKTKAALLNSSKVETKMFQPSIIHLEKKHSSSDSKNRILTKTDTATKEILIFIVDDDTLYLMALEQSILNKLPSIKIKTFLTGESCLQQMKLKPDIVILDYFLNSNVAYAWNGLTILKQIKKLNPKTKVIMVSAQDSLDIAVKCIDNGSFDYISKSESAFVKINNVLINIIEDIKTNDKGLKPYQIIGVTIIVLFVLYLLLIKF